MTRNRDLDELLERKIGERHMLKTCELTLENDEEFYLLIKAFARMADADATDCPFEMVFSDSQRDIKVGKWWLPNCEIVRKELCRECQQAFGRLTGRREPCYIRSAGAFSA